MHVKLLVLTICFLGIENGSAMSPYERMLKKEPSQGESESFSLKTCLLKKYKNFSLFQVFTVASQIPFVC
jgi:hypothetical protein